MAKFKKLYVSFELDGERETGIAVDAICNPYWHPYLYRAFIVMTEDGVSHKVHAAKVKILGPVEVSS